MRRLLTIGVLFVSLPALAANHYILKSAAGANNGTDWTNAWTSMPISFVRGDTYYVGTGNYQGTANEFRDPLSGTLAVTIHGATAANHGTNTGWRNSFGVDVSPALFSRWVFRYGSYAIDGDPDTNRGEATTHCGSTVCGFVVDVSTLGVAYTLFLDGGNGLSHITVKNTEIKGLGAMQTSTDSAGILLRPNGGTFDQITIRYNYIHALGTGGCVGTSGGVAALVIDHNFCTENLSTSQNHEEAITTCGSTGLVVSNNIFKDIHGTAGSLVSLNAGTPCADSGVQIYGNVFWSPSNISNGNGAAACINGNICSNWVVYNNTCDGLRHCWVDFGDSSGPGSSVSYYNNLNYRCVSAIHRMKAGGKLTTGYNWYQDACKSSAEAQKQIGPSNPFVDEADGKFHLTADTKAGLGSALATASPDPHGTARTGSRGAFQFRGPPR